MSEVFDHNNKEGISKGNSRGCNKNCEDCKTLCSCAVCSTPDDCYDCVCAVCSEVCDDCECSICEQSTCVGCELAKYKTLAELAAEAPVEEPVPAKEAEEEAPAEEAIVEEEVVEPAPEASEVEEAPVEEPVPAEEAVEESPAEEPIVEEEVVESAPEASEVEEVPVEEPVPAEEAVEESPAEEPAVEEDVVESAPEASEVEEALVEEPVPAEEAEEESPAEEPIVEEEVVEPAPEASEVAEAPAEEPVPAEEAEEAPTEESVAEEAEASEDEEDAMLHEEEEEQPAEPDPEEASKEERKRMVEELKAVLATPPRRRYIAAPSEKALVDDEFTVEVLTKSEMKENVQSVFKALIKEGVKLGYLDKYDGLSASEIKEEYEGELIYEVADQELRKVALKVCEVKKQTRIGVYAFSWDGSDVHHLGYLDEQEKAEALIPYITDKDNYIFNICGIITGGKFKSVELDPKSGKIKIKNCEGLPYGIELDIAIYKKQ